MVKGSPGIALVGLALGLASAVDAPAQEARGAVAALTMEQARERAALAEVFPGEMGNI